MCHDTFSRHAKISNGFTVNKMCHDTFFRHARISDGFTAKKCIVIHFSDKQIQGSASKHNMHTLKIRIYTWNQQKD